MQSERSRRNPSQRQVAKGHVLNHGAHDRIGLQHQVEVAPSELVDQMNRRVPRDFDLQPRKGAVDSKNQLREPGVDDGFDDTDPDSPRVQLAVDHAFAHLVHGAHEALRKDECFAAVECQCHFAVAAFEQPNAELLLQRRDATGYRGLRRVQFLGSHAEISQLREPDERFEEAYVHC